MRDAAHEHLVEAIEGAYRRRYPAFVRTLTALLGNGEDARETVQEAFATGLRLRSEFRGEGALEGWLWRIAFNLARDRLRRRQHDGFLSEVSVELHPPWIDEDMRAAVRSLSERQRLVVFLRYYADLSYDQIAEALDVSSGTVAATLHQAHRLLRCELQEAAR